MDVKDSERKNTPACYLHFLRNFYFKTAFGREKEFVKFFTFLNFACSCQARRLREQKLFSEIFLASFEYFIYKHSLIRVCKVVAEYSLHISISRDKLNRVIYRINMCRRYKEPAVIRTNHEMKVFTQGNLSTSNIEKDEVQTRKNPTIVQPTVWM